MKVQVGPGAGGIPVVVDCPIVVAKPFAPEAVAHKLAGNPEGRVGLADVSGFAGLPTLV